MLRKGNVGLLRQALQYGLQQPVQQSCVQLQVLSLQAVRFRSKPSNPKFRQSQTKVQKLDAIIQRALDRATAVKYAAASAVPVTPQAFGTSGTQPAAAAAADASTADATGEPAAAAGPSSQADTESSSSDSSTPSSESGAASSSTTSDSSSSNSDTSGWQPSWMRSLRGMIKGDSGRRRPRAKASPLTPVAATTDAKQAEQQEERQKELQAQQQQEDGWGKMLATAKDLSLDDYAQQLANDPKSDDFERPPRPMTPFRGPRANYLGAFDHARVQYLRYEMLHSLIVAMSQADKLRIKLNPTLHRDPAALKQLADATAYPPDAVRDLCEQFHKSRREFQLLHEFHSSGGKMPPFGDAAKSSLLNQRLRDEDKQRRVKEILAGRDIKACQLRNMTADILLNPKTLMKRICPQTQLAYAQCCGRKSRFNLKATLKAKAARRGVYEAARMKDM